MDSLCCHPKDYEAVGAADLTETYRGEDDDDDDDELLDDLEQDETATIASQQQQQRHRLEVAALSVLRWYPPTLNHPPPFTKTTTTTTNPRRSQARTFNSSSSSSNSSSFVEEEDPVFTWQRHQQRQSVKRMIAICIFLLCLFGISLGVSIVIQQHLGQRSSSQKGSGGMVVPSSPSGNSNTTTTTTTNTTATNRTTTIPAAPILVDYPPEVVDGDGGGGSGEQSWITAPMAAAASHVTIPRPLPSNGGTTPPPPMEEAACPHLQENLVDWRSVVDSENENGDITLPENTQVILRHNVTLGSDGGGILTIPSTTVLIVADDHTDTDTRAEPLTLTLGGMVVKGALVMGSESCPYQGQFILTLTGSRPTATNEAVPNHHKGIVVSQGGRLDWHGQSYTPTWTRLAKRVRPGDDDIYLQDVVNWKVGHEIVVLTSAMRDSRDWHHNEVRTIVQVETVEVENEEGSGDDSTTTRITRLVLDRPLDYIHIARLEYQVEVGLLTRNIQIQGSLEDSVPTETGLDCALTKTGKPSQVVQVFGYDKVACPLKDGYGGHVMIEKGGLAFVEGVELKRMGQTNVLGRYPMHFHLLGEDCPGCYFKRSSIHQSYYRCVSIHGTNGIEVSENVAFDIIGFCFYLEDGVEEGNLIAYNLAAHIHTLGETPANGDAQYIDPIVASSDDLILPADVAASGFYITNLHNRIIGNVAVGGWAGFAFPILMDPIGSHRDSTTVPNPSARLALEIDGNTAHSTAHYWGSAAAFYFGGTLYYNEDDVLEYNAGRDLERSRNPCKEGQEDTPYLCNGFNRISNSKVFLVPHVGIGSWSGRMEVVRYESHDVGLSAEALAQGFWMTELYAQCRTGEALLLPIQQAQSIRGDGFFWYDTAQDHIITDSTLVNCGVRSDEWDQYDTSSTRGCAQDNIWNGCDARSTNFGFLTHSDEFNPEIMQGTRNITFIEAGRRFSFAEDRFESVSGRLQNWLDVDGSVSGLGETTLIGSGYTSAGLWWNVDDNVVMDEQGPLTFVRRHDGPSRGLGHIRLEWDQALHDTVGVSQCFNGRWDDIFADSCPTIGHVRHLGRKYQDDRGLPLTANPDIAGLTGGYGWLVSLDRGSPHTLKISQVDLTPGTGLFLALQYPAMNTLSFSVKAFAGPWCWDRCEEVFQAVNSMEDVRFSYGNVYHFDSETGILYLRISMFQDDFIPDWQLYSFEEPGDGLKSFTRNGVTLPYFDWENGFEIVVDCPREEGSAYCSDLPPTFPAWKVDNVCSHWSLQQVSYDTCCNADRTACEHPLFPTIDNDLLE